MGNRHTLQMAAISSPAAVCTSRWRFMALIRWLSRLLIRLSCRQSDWNVKISTRLLIFPFGINLHTTCPDPLEPSAIRGRAVGIYSGKGGTHYTLYIRSAKRSPSSLLRRAGSSRQLALLSTNANKILLSRSSTSSGPGDSNHRSLDTAGSPK